MPVPHYLFFSGFQQFLSIVKRLGGKSEDELAMMASRFGIYRAVAKDLGQHTPLLSRNVFYTY
jgi:hypothetical protein